MNEPRFDRPSKHPLVHLRVVAYAAAFGLGAYAFIHGLRWLIAHTVGSL
ncbi:MAG: hypothetical protein H3C28_07430 [Sphingomonadales bacterium]|nr:hypothetical protein [Sphingomonadales bacterium]